MMQKHLQVYWNITQSIDNNKYVSIYKDDIKCNLLDVIFDISLYLSSNI